MKRMKICTDNGMTFKEGFDEFLDSCKARNLREGTLIHYKDSYRSIKGFIDEETPIMDISNKNVEKFILGCKKDNIRNTQTIYTYTKDLKTILYFFMRMGYMKSFKITLPKVDKTTIEVYTDAELKILLKNQI